MATGPEGRTPGPEDEQARAAAAEAANAGGAGIPPEGDVPVFEPPVAPEPGEQPVVAADGGNGGEQPPEEPPIDDGPHIFVPVPQEPGRVEAVPAPGGAGGGEGGNGGNGGNGGEQPPFDGDDEHDDEPRIEDLSVQEQLDIMRRGQNELRTQLEATTRQLEAANQTNAELVGLLRESMTQNQANIERLIEGQQAQTAALLDRLQQQQPRIEQETGRRWTGGRIAAAAVAGVVALGAAVGVGYLVGNNGKDNASAKPEGNTPSKLSANERQELKLLSKYMHVPDENSQDAKILLKKLNKAEDAKTVAGTAARLDANSNNVKAYIALLGSKMHNPDIVDHNSTRDAVNSMQKFEKYGGQDKNQYDYAVAVADAVASSDANAAMYYNIMNGNSSQTELPSGVSVEQARAAIFQKLTQDGTKFSIETPTGTWKNYGQNGENVYVANIEHTNGSQRMFVVTYGDGSKMFFKLYKGAGGEDCVNFNVPAKITFRTTNPVIEQHFGPQAQPTPTHKVMGPIHGTNPDHPKIHNPGQPEKPCPPEEIVPPPTVIPPAPKVDHNTTPAGVPGAHQGVGGNGQETTRPVAGPAPANVGQPQAQTPAPEVAQDTTKTPETPGTATVTGEDHGTTAPAEQNTPGTQQPAQPISGDTTPPGA